MYSVGERCVLWPWLGGPGPVDRRIPVTVIEILEPEKYDYKVVALVAKARPGRPLVMNVWAHELELMWHKTEEWDV